VTREEGTEDLQSQNTHTKMPWSTCIVPCQILTGGGPARIPSLPEAGDHSPWRNSTRDSSAPSVQDLVVFIRWNNRTCSPEAASRIGTRPTNGLSRDSSPVVASQRSCQLCRSSDAYRRMTFTPTAYSPEGTLILKRLSLSVSASPYSGTRSQHPPGLLKPRRPHIVCRLAKRAFPR
jgi:hypothetical protein